MPGVFVGSTELTDVGDIKVGSANVQEVYVGSTKVFPTGAVDPSITFTWSPVTNEPLPSGTFTRASVKQEYDGADYTELSSGTIPENSAAVFNDAQGFRPDPSAVNQCTESSDYNTTWAPTGLASLVDDGDTGLGLTQHTITLDTGTSNHSFFISSDPNQNLYVLAEEGTGRYLTIRAGTVATSNYAVFDLQNGTVTESGASTTGVVTQITATIYKCEIVLSSVNNFMTIGFSNVATPGTSAPSYTGTSETYKIFHTQGEATIFSTPPIITNGSEVTRVADVLDTDVTITTAFSALLDVTLPEIIGTGNTITLLGPDVTFQDILLVDASFNVIMADGTTPVTIGTSSAGARFKVSYGRDAAGRSGSLDGATAVTGGSPSATHEGETFQLGSLVNGNQSRCIQHLSTLFNVRKSDAELEALSA